MKLHRIPEDRNVLLIEDMLHSGVINEDAVDLIDDAAELVFGAIGFIPGAGEIVGDLPMLVKNIVQKDYLGAAIFLVSMEPTPISDTIAKALRAIQKLAQRTGQEDRLNRWIGWLLKKSGGNPSQTVMGLFDKAKKTIDDVDDKAGRASDADDAEVKQAGGIMDRVTKYIVDNLDKMETALREFLGLIEKRASELEPTGGADMPDEYSKDLAKDIDSAYRRIYKESGAKQALKYMQKIKANAKKKSEIKKAYEQVFGPIEEV